MKEMKEKIYDARTGMEYILIGDYYLPALPHLPKQYPAFHSAAGSDNRLVLIEQMSQRESISEKLKEENQMEWVRRMRNLENRAEEIVKAELIYTFERR